MFCPFSIQINWSVVSRVVAMLVDAIAALCGDLYRGHEIDNSANLLKSVNRKIELIVWEKIFIHKH